MSRGYGVVLVLLVLASALFAGWAGSAREAYFDPVLYRGSYPCTLEFDPTLRGPLDPEIERWFARPLRGAGEPSLYLNKPPAETSTLRFTFLPAFAEPVIVRIDDLYGDRPRLTATRYVDQVVIRDGPNRLTRNLTKAEVAPIVAFLSSSRVLNLPPDSCLSGVDGVVYLIEANGPEGYRFINRWGISSGPVYELANMMFGMTGWPNGWQGPRRTPARPYVVNGQPWPRPDPMPASEP